MTEEELMREAVRLAREKMLAGEGGPFGAVVARNGEVVSRGWNCVTSGNDPTAHAEVVAIREACAELGTFNLSGCELFASCEPCPMCLAAAYWARVDAVYYACTREDAADIGFDDAFIYDEIPLAPEKRSLKMRRLLREEGLVPFRDWAAKDDRIEY